MEGTVSPVDTRQLTTSDGHRLAADVQLPDDDRVGGVVVCHPHPLYGGNRHAPVVDAVFRHLPQAGLAALRFDFRAEHGGGVAERLDVVAALDELTALVGDVPLAVAGYSFGAVVALTTLDHRIVARSLVAPPLAMLGPAEVLPVPTQVLMPRHDQFTSLAATHAALEGWDDVELTIVEGADHFLAGHITVVAEAVTTWLAARPWSGHDRPAG